MCASDFTPDWQWSENRLSIHVPAGRLTLTPLADDLIRLRIEATGGRPVPPTGGVIRGDWPGPAAGAAAHATGEGQLLLTAGRLRVAIDLSPLRLQWYDGDRLFAVDEAVAISRSQITLHRQMPPDEHYYGFGQKMGFLDKRGRKMTMWATDDPLHTPTADPLYQSIPFFIALRAGQSHGLFVDTVARSVFDMGSLDPADAYSVTAESPVFDAYIFSGPAMKAIIARYTELTGRMEMPPLWALGFHQCRWSYYPDARIRELAATFREKQIPCDALWLDIDYMDGYRVFTWDPDRFPDPAGLAADMLAQGFRLVTIVDPGVKVDAEYPVYQEGVAGGHFVTNADGTVHEGIVWPGVTAYPDFLKEATRRWWGDRHVEAYFAQGISGIWNDMNEPSSFIQNNEGEKTLPPDAKQGDDGRRFDHKDVHNAYGLLMNQATHAAWKRHRPDRRPFILTRSGAQGVQRYAAVWMGDNHSWWEHIPMHMTLCAGMGLSGVPFAGTDVGGFGANPNGELVARWIQLGAFTPFFRMHAAAGTRDQEPWSFGPEVESICRKYINLRYRLLPFFYTLFEEAHRTGLPIMRPVVLEHQDDPETCHLSDQVLIGRDVLVAPITQPGATRRAVYLPEGVWYDFWTGRRYEGRQYVLAEAALDVLPLYVRGGAVLPMGPEMAHTGAVPMETLTLHVFPGTGEYELYEDAGEGYGPSCRTRIRVAGSRVEVGRPEGGFTPPWRRVEVLLHGEAGVTCIPVEQAGGFAVEG